MKSKHSRSATARRDDRRAADEAIDQRFRQRGLHAPDESRPSPLCPGCGLPCSTFGTRRAFREHREGCEA